MAKSNTKTVKATIRARGTTKIDGEIVAVDAYGITINTRAMGRRTMVNQVIPMANVLCYTGTLGAGYVIADAEYELPIIAGSATMDGDDLVITDADDVEIVFPGGKPNNGAVYIQEVADDDRSLNRSSVNSAVRRRSSGGSKSEGKPAKKKGRRR